MHWKCFSNARINIHTHHLKNSKVEGRHQQENNIFHQPEIFDHYNLSRSSLLFGDLTTRPLDLDTGVTAGVHWGPGTGRAGGGDQDQAAEADHHQGAEHCDQGRMSHVF